MSELKSNFAFVSTSGEDEIGLAVFRRRGRTSRADENRWVRMESYEMKTPKFMCVSQNKILFVLNNEYVGPREIENVGSFPSVVRGMLRSYQINPTFGSLTLLSTVQTGGTNPVHMCVSEAHDALVVAQEHSVVVFDLSKYGVIGYRTCLYQDQYHCLPRYIYQPIQVHLIPRKTDKISASQNLLILERYTERIAMHRLENKEVKSQVLKVWQRQSEHKDAISKMIVDEKQLMFAINYNSDVISVFDRRENQNKPSYNLKIDLNSPPSPDMLKEEEPLLGVYGGPALTMKQYKRLERIFSTDSGQTRTTTDDVGTSVFDFNPSMLDVKNASLLDTQSCFLDQVSLESGLKSPENRAKIWPILQSARMAFGEEPESKGTPQSIRNKMMKEAIVREYKLAKAAEKAESKAGESEPENEEEEPTSKKPDHGYFDLTGFSLMEHEPVASGSQSRQETEWRPVESEMKDSIMKESITTSGDTDTILSTAEYEKLCWDVVVNFKMNTIYVVKSSYEIEVYKMNKKNNRIALSHMRSEILPDDKRPKSLKLMGDKLFVCTNRDIVIYKISDKRVPIVRKNYTIDCLHAEQIVFYHENLTESFCTAL